MTQNSLPADAPSPRLCVIEKKDGETEYGYNLHAEKGRGQFVGLVDAGSPAERGGLVQGDRIFAVNGHSIIGDNHKKVVERIKQNPTKCEMLVISEEGAAWYDEHKIAITLDLPNIQRVAGNMSTRPANGSPPPNGSWYAPTSVKSISKSATETPVFVPPPPPVYEIEMTPQPLPRLSHLEKSSPTDEFGFNLHAERNRGHFIGTVDVGGIGERAGLRMGQRIVGVNGLLVYPNTPHKEVVALIKKKPLATTLLVASEDVDKWYRDNNVEYSFENSEKFGEAQPLTNQNDVEHQNHSKSNGFEVSAEILPNHNSHSIQVNEEHETKTTTIRKTEVTDSYQYKNPIASNPHSINNDDQEADLMSAVFQNVTLPETKVRTIGDVQVLSHTKELSDESRRSSISTVSTHRESAVDVPVNHKYIPSYTSPNQHQQHYEQNLDEHQCHIGTQQHQQPSPLSNGSSHGYAGGSTSGYDDDDIYHLTAREARERLRLKNRKHHLHDMSLNEKYQLVSNM